MGKERRIGDLASAVTNDAKKIKVTRNMGKERRIGDLASAVTNDAKKIKVTRNSCIITWTALAKTTSFARGM